MKNKRDVVLRVGLGAVLGIILAPLTTALFQSMSVVRPGFVTEGLLELTGSLWGALVLQSLLGGLLGGVVAMATLPFAEDGKELVVRSLAHFCATAAAFALYLWGSRLITEPLSILGWLLMLAVLYLLIWLGRWVGWYQEVVQLRTMLGLAPGPSPLRWRETLSYLPFALLICLVMPAVLFWVDITFVQDVPVFSGVLYPIVCLPVVSFCSGLSLGRHKGLCLLYPVLCFVCYLPAVFLVFNSSALFHCFLTAVPALAGVLLGAWRRGKN